MKIRKLLSLVLTIVMLCSCMTILPVYASAGTALEMNISTTACSANLSNASLPTAQVPKQGDTYYINLACTNDLKLSVVQFYVKAPWQSDFSSIYSYAPRGYFRWVNCSYTFSQCGTYTVRAVITRTDGAQCSGNYTFYVEEKPVTESDSGTYTYGDKTFHVVPNFKSDYCFNQNDYSRFVNRYGKNRGCTAVAMCIAYSIYHDSALSPNDVKWSSVGCSWEKCNRYNDGIKTYSPDNYTQYEALAAAYNSIYSGVPVIVGVNGAGCDHVVTIVGVRENADSGNLALSDFLIVDPYGGDVETLDTYTSIDRSWSVRIPQ